MPSVSRNQQQLMGAVHAYQKGGLKNPSAKVKNVARHIKPEDARDFAETKHKGLPVKKNKKEEKRAAVTKLANLVTNAVLLDQAGIIKLSIGPAMSAASPAIPKAAPSISPSPSAVAAPAAALATAPSAAPAEAPSVAPSPTGGGLKSLLGQLGGGGAAAPPLVG